MCGDTICLSALTCGFETQTAREDLSRIKVLGIPCIRMTAGLKGMEGHGNKEVVM